MLSSSIRLVPICLKFQCSSAKYSPLCPCSSCDINYFVLAVDNTTTLFVYSLQHAYLDNLFLHTHDLSAFGWVHHWSVWPIWSLSQLLWGIFWWLISALQMLYNVQEVFKKSPKVIAWFAFQFVEMRTHFLYWPGPGYYCLPWFTRKNSLRGPSLRRLWIPGGL